MLANKFDNIEKCRDEDMLEDFVNCCPLDELKRRHDEAIEFRGKPTPYHVAMMAAHLIRADLAEAIKE